METARAPQPGRWPGVRRRYVGQRSRRLPQRINDSIVLILMIETLEGLKNADEIAKVPGVTAVFAASGDLGNLSGFQQGPPDDERAIDIVHDAAVKAGVRLCGPLAWLDRADETAAIARGAAAELGPLANTQGKPDVGPSQSPRNHEPTDQTT